MHENPRYQTRQTFYQTCRDPNIRQKRFDRRRKSSIPIEIFYRMTRFMSIYVLVRVDVAKRGMRTEERK